MTVAIGPFGNVPAPNDQVKSDWAQEISNYAWNSGAGYRPESSVSYASVESGDLGAAPGTVVKTVAVPVINGRVYDIRGYVTIVNRAGSGAVGAAMYLSALPSFVICGREQYIHVPSVSANADLSGIWIADRTATVTFELRVERAWWSAVGVRYQGNNSNPLGIRVIDVGVPHAPT